MRRHFQVHLHLTNLCCQWKAAPDERDVSPPESAAKVGGKCVIEPLKSGEPCHLLEKVEPALQPVWRACHANWRGQGPSDSGPHFPEFPLLCGCLERWWGSSSYKLTDHQHV